MNPDQLKGIFPSPLADPFRKVLHKRLSQNPALDRKITYPKPNQEMRDYLTSILGRTFRGTNAMIPLDRLDQILRESGAAPEGLIAAIEYLEGPLRNRKEEQEQARMAWDTLFETAATWDTRPWVHAWLAYLKRTGMLKKQSNGNLDRAQTFLHQIIKAAQLLPHKGILLKELAVKVAGDAHLFDHGNGELTLLLKLAGCWGQEAEGRPASERECLRAMGVQEDVLSSMVLTYGLRCSGNEGLGQILNLATQAGQPIWLTFRQLQDQETQILAQAVYICENPAVVQAAADRLGQDCKPLICLSGKPHGAARLLLSGLQEQGVTLYIHTDFDKAGLDIVAQIKAQFNAIPWRMSAQDYQAVDKHLPLHQSDRPIKASWCPELADAMNEAGKALHEEAVLDQLLADLEL